MMNSARKSTVILVSTYLTLYLIAGIMIISSLRYRREGTATENIDQIDTVSASVSGGPWETVTLPYTFENLPPRTPVSVRTSIAPGHYDYLCIKTVYSPSDVFFDGELKYSFGREGKYPSYFADPPTEINMVETDGTGHEIDLQVDYYSPVSRDSLIIHPYMVGTSKEIMLEYGKRLGTPMVLSLVQVIVGCIMLVLSLCLMFFDSKGQVFLWLGLFSKFSGIWFLCENNFSVLSFKGTSLLYLLSFIGFFTFVVPLLRFFRVAVDFRNPKQLRFLEAFTAITAIIAMLLQFTGILSFPKSMYFFHVSIPATLILTTFLIVREAFIYHNSYATRFVLPVGILTLSAVLELFNYHIHLTYIFSSIFQAGMFIFLFLISFTAGMSVKDSISLRKKEEQLERDRKLLDIQTEEQRKTNLLMVENQQKLSRQRHDLRHHLAAIQELSGDNKPLQEYLETLVDKIPKAQERYCENTVVNAVISHYAGICEQNGIRLNVKLMIPKIEDKTIESNLCVIFSNLLENAVEACGRMNTGEKYIRLNSTVRQGLLTVTMDNSFNGTVTQLGDRFRSEKRDDFGIGLASVQSIAREAHGGTDFHAEGNVFLSSVYLRLS